MKTIPGLSLVNEDLALVESKMREAPHENIEPLATALDVILSSGGKRLRPALALLASRLYRPPGDKVVSLAAAVEMLHTATLVHDDLIDNALLRRGNPTLNAVWSPGATILTGDFLFAWAASLAAQTENVRVMKVFAQTLMVICSGELRQLFRRPWREQTREDYDRRIYAKTASLFAAATESAAVLVSALEPEVQALRVYGQQLGMAFQIVDDVLDFVGSSKEMGKPVGSDMRQGIVTLPTLHYLEQHADDELLAQVYEGQADNPVIEAAVARIRQAGAVEAAMDDARAYVKRAQAALTSFPANGIRQVMLDLADFVVQRRT
ncbi:MAG: polyprenyl synthetase family protein [Anaerolineae bacterium]|nr:MAG: polyprenyl synthetase family protein [Anaerolineae bacterium]